MITTELYFGMAIATYIYTVIIIFIYQIKNAHSHSSPLAIAFISILFPIAYPIKFLFDLSND